MDFGKDAVFLDEFLKRIADRGIDVSDLEMDHIAVKTSTLDEY
jgi:hypothetical protein